jgi:hypothetical protein
VLISPKLARIEANPQGGNNLNAHWAKCAIVCAGALLGTRTNSHSAMCAFKCCVSPELTSTRTKTGGSKEMFCMGGMQRSRGCLWIVSVRVFEREQTSP